MSRSNADPRFRRHLPDWTFVELDAARAAVEVLLASPGWAVVEQLLLSEMAALDKKLSSGDKPLEQAEYALLHGQRAGLNAASAAILAVLSKAEERRIIEEAVVGAAAGAE